MFAKKTSDFNLNSIIDNCIVWKDDVGYLPGSSLKFKRDQDGELWLHDQDENSSASSSDDDDYDDDENDSFETIRKKQKLIKDHLFDRNDNDHLEISLCSRCFKSDFRENLLKNNKYCKQCAQIDPQMYKIYKNFDSHSTPKNIDQDEEKHINPLRKLTQRKLSNDFELPTEFEWEKYLSKYQIESLPSVYFLPEQNYPSMRNEFKVGMKLEGIDPSHPSKFCVLSIVDIQGFRLRLHFDGYNGRFDFWVNADSKQIFPIGFCKKTYRKLEYPPGLSTFNWKIYLSVTNSKAAPENLFSINKVPFDRSIIKEFSINDKLEAVDIANSALICVATIKDILNDQILIHFDGWDDSFDYWTPVTSPLIHPINWYLKL